MSMLIVPEIVIIVLQETALETILYVAILQPPVFARGLALPLIANPVPSVMVAVPMLAPFLVTPLLTLLEPRLIILEQQDLVCAVPINIIRLAYQQGRFVI